MDSPAFEGQKDSLADTDDADSWVQNVIEVYATRMKPRLDMTGRIKGIGWEHDSAVG